MSTIQHFEELELIAEKAGELNDRVGKIENELGTQTKTLESAALVLDAAIKGLGALKSSVLENDLGALQLALNDKTTHLAREIGRFETAVAEIDRRAESGDAEIKAALLETAKALRSQFETKQAELSEWSAKVELTLAEQAKQLAAIPPVIKGADAPTFNPRGEWEAGMVANRLDVVSYAGSSYISNFDANTDKPGKSANYTTLAKRAGSIAMGGVGDMAGLTGTVQPQQIVPGSTAYAVGDILYAATTTTLAKLAAGTSGKLLCTQGAGAAPIWVAATGGAGDVNGPASATDNAITRFDGTGGKTVQNSGVTIDDSDNLTVPGTLITVGPGGTGSANGVLNIKGSSASSYGAQLRFTRNATNLWTLGHYSSIQGGTSDDLLIYNATASGEMMRFSASGFQMTMGPGGTGTDNAIIVIAGASTSSYGAQLRFVRGSTNKWTFGHYSSIQGGTSDDLLLYNPTASNEALRVSSATSALTAVASFTAHSATAIPAGGTAGAGLMVSSTANFGVFFGSGAPTLSAAKGSLYLRSDGSSASTRAYINTDGSTTWTAVTTAA